MSETPTLTSTWNAFNIWLKLSLIRWPLLEYEPTFLRLVIESDPDNPWIYLVYLGWVMRNLRFFSRFAIFLTEIPNYNMRRVPLICRGNICFSQREAVLCSCSILTAPTFPFKALVIIFNSKVNFYPYIFLGVRENRVGAK